MDAGDVQLSASVTVELPALLPWQKQVAVDDTRFQVLCCGRRTGKALALDTPVPTPRGWTTMGDLRDGDELFDDQGRVCKVVRAHEVLFGQRCYRVAFSDGTEIIADAGHKWRTQTATERKRETRALQGSITKQICGIRTTAEILETIRFSARGDNNHSIGVTGPLHTPEAKLPIHPWVLGYWLGNGHSRSGAVCIGEHDEDAILVQIARCGHKVGNEFSRGKGSVSYTIGRGDVRVRKHADRDWLYFADPLVKQLRRTEVLGNKHVPAPYLRASNLQRLQLLQGLVDSDGYVSKGIVEFCNTNKRIAEAAHELAISLGIKATLREGRATLEGRDCGPKYRVCFTTGIPVCTTPRKIAELHRGGSRKQQLRRRYVTVVEPIESVPVRCITVDSPSSLFLVSRAMIPTHNSEFALIKALAATFRGQRIYWVGKIFSHSERVRRQAKQWLHGVPREIAWWRDVDKMLVTANGGELHWRSADKPDNLRSEGLNGAILDEADFMDQSTWFDAIRPSLSDKQGWALFASTPNREKGWFHRLFDRGMSNDSDDVSYRSWQFPTWENPIILASEIDEARRDMPPITFRREYGAEFVSAAGAKVSRDWINIGTPPSRHSLVKVVAGADLAISTRKGSAWTAVVVMGLERSGKIWVLDAQRARVPIAQQAKLIADVCEPWRPDKVGIEKALHATHLVEELLAGTNLAVWPIAVKGDKETRFAPLEARYAARRVWHAPHVSEAFVDEICSFPIGSFSDQVDAASLACNLLGDGLRSDGGYVPRRKRRPAKFRI